MPPVLIESLVLLIPGALLTAVLFRPGSLTIPGLLTLAFVGGYSVAALVAWALALLSVLTPATLLAGLATVSVLFGALAWRRGPPGERLRDLKAQLRADPWDAVLGLTVMGVVAWVRLSFSPVLSLPTNTGMRFWADGLEIATAGEIPDRTLQWGQSIAPAASKMLFNCFTAAMSLLGGPDALPNIAGAVWLIAVFTIPALWWLGRELGLGLTAPVLSLVLAGNPTIITGEFTRDLNPYRAESVGRVVAFSALALAIAAIRENSGRSRFVIVGLLFAIATPTHLVPTAVSLGILLWWVVYCLGRRRVSRQVVTRLAAGLVLGAAVASIIWFLPNSTLAFGGVTERAPVAAPEDRFDPTLLFSQGRRVPLEAIQERDWYTPPAALARRLVGITIKAPVQNGWLWIGVAAGLAVLMTLVAPERLRPVGVVSMALTTNTVLATLLFARVYDAGALANFGLRRLADYGPLIVWLLLLLMIELILIGIKRIDRRLPVVGILVSALLLLIILMPDLREVGEGSERNRREIEVLNWVRDNTPCDVRILSNKRTSGTFQVLTGRAGVNEGMGPFFRPELLRNVNRFLIRTNRFFANPSDNGPFLTKHGVDYVLLFWRAGGRTRDLRSARGYPMDMEEAPFLELLHGGGGASIYRVNAVDSSEHLPEPSDHPGYVCQRGPIKA
jgi:hypothetical protein